MKRLLYLLLLLFLLVDIGYSFIQHLHQPLDGDMSGNLVPADEVKTILERPFGLDAIINNKAYPNPNRFYCHWMFEEYLVKTPLLLQKIVDPIDSVYLSCAISKILLQILLIILLAISITGTRNVFRSDFLIAAVFVTPFFQTNGYRGYMGIIDPSTTYTFFYALPFALLLLYFIPFILQFYHGKKLSKLIVLKIIWIPLAVIICLSGPLNPGIILVFSMLVILTNLKSNYTRSNQKVILKRTGEAITMIPGNYWFYLLPVCLLSVYSLFLGRYNSFTIYNQIPIYESYLKLPYGIYCQITHKLAFPMLLLILAINSLLIKRKFKTDEGQKILNIFKWIGIFSLCYVLLLPLGGYRPYRPNIVRYDTILPVTLCLLFVFGTSTLFILKNLTNKQKKWYLPILLGILLIFINADKAITQYDKCERGALKEIAESQDSIVLLPENCLVLSWDKIEKPEDSELNSELLMIWQITKDKKLYYNK